MSPEFDELVGTDLAPGERERLERVHDLLIAAGPPPEPAAKVVALPTRRAPRKLLALAAALAIAAFALGAALVDGSGSHVDFVEALHGTTSAADASGSLTVFELDQAGNWPMELSIEGLAPRTSGRPFELWLTRDGELAALCGGFLTDDAGSAVVPMNAPYRFDDYDGWVVVEEGTKTPLLTTSA